MDEVELGDVEPSPPIKWRVRWFHILLLLVIIFCGMVAAPIVMSSNVAHEMIQASAALKAAQAKVLDVASTGKDFEHERRVIEASFPPVEIEGHTYAIRINPCVPFASDKDTVVVYLSDPSNRSPVRTVRGWWYLTAQGPRGNGGREPQPPDLSCQ